MTDQQFGKLPKFAQQEITILRTLLANATTELQSVGDKTPTRIRWGYDSLGGAFGFINEIETVFFHIGDIRRRKFIRVRLREGGEVLNVNTDGGLSVEPNSTNDIDLRLRHD